MKFNKKIVWTSVIAVALALGGIYIASRQNAITHVIGDNNFEGSEKEWCDSLLDKLVVIDKKNCQIGKQKISQYSLTKKKHYAEKDRVRVVGYATDDNRELMLHLSDGNRIAVGKSDKKQKSSQRTHKVTFIDYDNNVLNAEIVLQNKNATPPIVKERKNYRFDKWNKSYEHIKSDLQIKALYKEDNTVTRITVANVKVQPGQTNVKVPVKIANNTGILGMTWSVYYDDSRLKLKDIKNGKAFKDILTLTKAGKLKNGCKCMWDGQQIEDYQIQDGEIAELLFDIPKSTTSGVYQIKIKYEEGDVIDKNLLPVSPLIANGKITITH